MSMYLNKAVKNKRSQERVNGILLSIKASDYMKLRELLRFKK